MKKYLKIFILILLLIPAIFIFSGCEKEDLLSSVKITNIEQTYFDEDSVTYKITYADGSSFEYEVPINNTVSISTILKTSSNLNKDIYTITLSNGDTSTFEVNNGVSVNSINYSHSEGLIDYYVISYSNGTASMFSVTNGADGVTLQDMYEEANKDGKYADILEFIDEYLKININANATTIATGKAITSAVSIYAFSPVSGAYYLYKYGTEKYYTTSCGAGVIYNLDKQNGNAYIITNCHVVYSEDNDLGTDYATEIYCYLYGQESGYGIKTENGNYLFDSLGYPVINGGKYGIRCELVGASIDYDIAVLKVTNNEILKNSNARQCDIANSDKVVLADKAIAIGNPDAEGIAVTEGVISVISEYIDVSIDSSKASSLREFRIDTAVNGGNSGGGLFNDKGELIGIVNAKTSDNTLENMGYAIPSNVAVAVADNLIYYCKNGNLNAKKITVGITPGVKSSITQYNYDTLTTEIVEEVIIAKIEQGSLAETQFDFEEGEVIKSVSIFDGINTLNFTITRYYQLADIILKVRAGNTLTFYCTTDTGTAVHYYTVQEEDLKNIR